MTEDESMRGEGLGLQKQVSNISELSAEDYVNNTIK